jgi:predicted DNA-binding transcriptional regulator AlpA
MWIRRRMQSDGFPAPTYFGRTRHWRLSEIIAWENEQAKTAAPKMSHGFHKESA